jgi:hypothetical protein
MGTATAMAITPNVQPAVAGEILCGPGASLGPGDATFSSEFGYEPVEAPGFSPVNRA